jgi:hypothetical protein
VLTSLTIRLADCLFGIRKKPVKKESAQNGRVVNATAVVIDSLNPKLVQVSRSFIDNLSTTKGQNKATLKHHY